MSPPRFLVAASIALNAALIWILAASRSTPAPVSTVPLSLAARPSVATAPASSTRDQAIAAGDVPAMVAAGLSKADSQAIAAGAAYARYRDKLRAVIPPKDPDPRYWRNSPGPRAPVDLDRRDALVQAERELADTLKAIFGEDVHLQGIPDLRLSFLPEWKQNTLRRLEQDYQDFELDIQRSNAPLPSDNDRLAVLRAQKAREISALLTPEELKEYDLRGSPRAQTYLSGYGGGLETEDDFRFLQAAMLGHDERFSGVSPGGPGGAGSVAASNADLIRTLEVISAKFGPEKFAALQNFRDNDRSQLESLRARLGLPDGTTEKVLTLRERYSLESKRIAGDPATPAAQKSQNVRALGTQARDELIAILGSEAGRAYTIRQQNWPELLSRGVAFTTDRNEMYGGRTTMSATYPWSAPRPPAP